PRETRAMPSCSAADEAVPGRSVMSVGGRMYLENKFGLPPLTSRVTAANDITDCIDEDRLARGEWAPPAEIPLVDIGSFPHIGRIDHALRGGRAVPHRDPTFRVCFAPRAGRVRQSQAGSDPIVVRNAASMR